MTEAEFADRIKDAVWAGECTGDDAEVLIAHDRAQRAEIERLESELEGATHALEGTAYQLGEARAEIAGKATLIADREKLIGEKQAEIERLKGQCESWVRQMNEIGEALDEVNVHDDSYARCIWIMAEHRDAAIARAKKAEASLSAALASNASLVEQLKVEQAIPTRTEHDPYRANYAGTLTIPELRNVLDSCRTDPERVICQVVLHDRKMRNELADAIARAEKAEARLPKGMEGCTIVFRQCARGHGWLAATNWAPFECQICAIEAERARAEKYLAAMTALVETAHTYAEWLAPMAAVRALVEENGR